MTRPSTNARRPRTLEDLQSLTRAEAIQEIQRLERKLDSMPEETAPVPAHSFLAEVSHELRTPITGIVKLAEILSEKAVDDQGKKFARLIEQSGKQLESTVEAVLSLAKLEAHDTALECRPLNVPDHVEPVFHSFKPLAQTKGLDCTLTVKASDEPLCASLHSGALSSIVQNLLSNAIKYTDEGSVCVTVRGVLDDETPSVEIEVADTGSGIAESFVTELFDRFSQESRTGHPFSDGVGLGLTLVKRFAQRMGGVVNVQTEEGEGSVFTVRFPRVSTRERCSQPASDPSPPLGQSTKEILFIESNSNTQRAIRALIKDRWGITPVSSIEEGLQLVDEHREASHRPFDLILLGVEREEYTSDEAFLRQLENHTNGRDIPVVALALGDRPATGYLTLDGYISEPFTSAKLVTEVARYLGG